MKIATLEDDPIDSRLIQRIITGGGHECTAYTTAQSLFTALESQTFDMLILDWHLPDMTGKDVIEWVRKSVGEDILVMLLTNRILEENIVVGLMVGADDYMTKPIRGAELSARIHALSRRLRRRVSDEPALRSKNIVQVGFFYFDLMRKIAVVRGESIELRPKEFHIAALLFNNIGQLIPREKIMEEVWGRELTITSRTLDTHMSQVRAKLRLKEDNRVRLTTVYTLGYRLDSF